MNVNKIRRDFQILNSGLIFLDNASTSLTPEPVIQKMLEYYYKYKANVQRGSNRLSQMASDEYENAHAKVANFINAKSISEIVMTRNCTEGINIIANGLSWEKENKVITSFIEHTSNFVVWARLKNRHKINLEIVKPREPIASGLLKSQDFEKVIDDKTKLVTITHVSNVLGTITPIKEIIEIAHDHGAYVLIDGAQSVPHFKVDVQKIGCDFLTFSGHKMCAPTGSGVLYIKEELIDKIEPLCIGGGTITDVGLTYFKLGESPMRFEAGTPAIAEVIGMGAAIEYLKKIEMKNIECHGKKLGEQIHEGLENIPKVKIFGPEPKDKIGITTFNVRGLNPHDVSLALDISSNILVRSGHHCAIPFSKEITGNLGSVRVSPYFYNTKEEITQFVSTVREIANKSNSR